MNLQRSQLTSVHSPRNSSHSEKNTFSSNHTIPSLSTIQFTPSIFGINSSNQHQNLLLPLLTAMSPPRSPACTSPTLGLTPSPSVTFLPHPSDSSISATPHHLLVRRSPTLHSHNNAETPEQTITIFSFSSPPHHIFPLSLLFHPSLAVPDLGISIPNFIFCFDFSEKGVGGRAIVIVEER